MDIVAQIFANASGQADNYVEDFFKTSNLESLCQNILGVLLSAGKELLVRTLEMQDKRIQDSKERKDKWHILRHENKQLVTVFGEINYQRTIFRHKEKKDGACSLLDQQMHIAPHQRITRDVDVLLVENAIKNSYENAGRNTLPGEEVLSRQTVKNKIRKVVLPVEKCREDIPQNSKKKVKYLHIDADEDHISLQFNAKKGDLKRVNGFKVNTMEGRLVYVYEGINTENQRHELINAHYFAGSYLGKDLENLWNEVYAYIENHYDTDYLEAIYLHSDGGSWIQSAEKYILKVKPVLDEFHIHKYITQATAQFGKDKGTHHVALLKEIRDRNKAGFVQYMDKLASAPNLTENGYKAITKCKDYICNHWIAACRNMNRGDEICGCSAEGHVRSILSDRLSTRPMGWSRAGAEIMVQLRAFTKNGGRISDLFYPSTQEPEIKQAAGAESVKPTKKKHNPSDGSWLRASFHPGIMRFQPFKDLSH